MKLTDDREKRLKLFAALNSDLPLTDENRNRPFIDDYDVHPL